MDFVGFFLAEFVGGDDQGDWIVKLNGVPYPVGSAVTTVTFNGNGGNWNAGGGTVNITGGTFTPKARRFLAETDNTWVEKPFNMCLFRKMVAERVTARKSPPKDAD